MTSRSCAYLLSLFHCRLIIIILNPNPSPSLSTHSSYNTGFDNWIISFFSNYFVNRRTNYSWNNFISPVFGVNIGVGQGSALSPILSVLYLLSRSLTVDFILFSLFTLFYFSFLFLFLFLEQLRLGFISHAVTSVTRLITRLGRRK